MTRDSNEYLSDILNDELWSELPLDEQNRLILGARATAERTLSEIALDLQDVTDKTERHNMLRRRIRTTTFISLCTQRSSRIKAAQREANIEANTFDIREKYFALREAVKRHWSVTTNLDSTDDELDQADTDLYAALGPFEAPAELEKAQ